MQEIVDLHFGRWFLVFEELAHKASPVALLCLLMVEIIVHVHTFEGEEGGCRGTGRQEQLAP